MTRPPQPPPEARGDAAVWFPLDELVPWKDNPRKIDDSQIDAVAESIRELGWGAPIVARLANKMIIAGHTRQLGGKRAGFTHGPVRFLDCTQEQAERLAVADNKLAEAGKWDQAELAALLGPWRDEGQDLGVLGFSDKEVARLLGENYESVEEVDVSALQAEFFLSVTGPLPQQPEVLDALRKHLAGLAGVEVSITTTQLL